ncbi:hypothetical protein L873DRAFT_1875362 [Choiromyces venosus 120613-1]|uniref:Uncharacterized protein n=1 Tax=Choiromyces venosus 120613-1 TaxID=1336337 RepID=A0A3N4J2P4_9PEZI|nr:hypothetical protein L873DRAFT_1875362 [Choiromyces venosus 120613-1]
MTKQTKANYDLCPREAGVHRQLDASISLAAPKTQIFTHAGTWNLTKSPLLQLQPLQQHPLFLKFLLPAHPSPSHNPSLPSPYPTFTSTLSSIPTSTQKAKPSRKLTTIYLWTTKDLDTVSHILEMEMDDDRGLTEKETEIAVVNWVKWNAAQGEKLVMWQKGV